MSPLHSIWFLFLHHLYMKKILCIFKNIRYSCSALLLTHVVVYSNFFGNISKLFSGNFTVVANFTNCGPFVCCYWKLLKWISRMLESTHIPSVFTTGKYFEQCGQHYAYRRSIFPPLYDDISLDLSIVQAVMLHLIDFILGIERTSKKFCGIWREKSNQYGTWKMFFILAYFNRFLLHSMFIWIFTFENTITWNNNCFNILAKNGE